MDKKFISLVFLWSIISVVNISIFAQDKQTILERYFDCSINSAPYVRELLMEENKSVIVSNYKVSFIQSLYDKNMAQCYCAFKVESIDGKKVENNMVDVVGRSLNGEYFGENNRYTFDLASDIYSGYSIGISAINENDSLIIFVKITGLGYSNLNNNETLKIGLVDNYNNVDNKFVEEFEISDRTKTIELCVSDTSKMIVSPIGILVEGDDVYNIEIYMNDGSLVNDSIRIVGGYDDELFSESRHVFEKLLDVEQIDKIIVDGKCIFSNE